MNKNSWTDAFSIQAEELLKLQPLQTVLHDGQVRDITIHSMYGNFACRKCKKTWSSTMCNTDVFYTYNFQRKRGEIRIDKEYQQDCKKCKIPSKPNLDDEATMRAMKIVVDRIKKIFYGIVPALKDSGDSSKHSRARERKKNHDSANCEACRLGKCTYGEDCYPGPRTGRGRANFDDGVDRRVRAGRIAWGLVYAKKYVSVLSK